MTAAVQRKLQNISIDDLCNKAVKVADDVDIMLGGVEWLIKSPDAKELISFFDPAIQENLDIVVAASVGPLRISEELLDKLDRYIIGPKCNRKSRNSKKQEGVKLMSDLFTNITNNEAYNKVCYVSKTTVDLLTKLVKNLGRILGSTVLTAGITAAAGPEVVIGLNEVYKSSKQALDLSKTIQQTVCVFLRKQAK